MRQNLCKAEWRRKFDVKKMQLFEVKPSFAFLVKVSLEWGNFTAVKLEAVERAFRYLLSVQKDETR